MLDQTCGWGLGLGSAVLLALAAELGPEGLNASYKAPAAEVRPFAERHPELLWIALIVAICALGVVALKSARNVGR